MVIVGAGPVGSLAALYAAQRGYIVEVYELRPGKKPNTVLNQFQPWRFLFFKFISPNAGF